MTYHTGHFGSVTLRPNDEDGTVGDQTPAQDDVVHVRHGRLQYPVQTKSFFDLCGF